MIFDVAMPLALLGITLASLFLNNKTEGKLKSTVEDRELGTKDAALLVVLMGVMISAVVFLRDLIAPLLILFMFSYSMLLFMFTYLFTKQRWYLALMPPIAFIIPYALLRDTMIWSGVLVNLYGAIFAVLITLYISSLFAWKSTAVFAGLLTIADIILVLIIPIMITAAETASNTLALPVLIRLPLIPLILHEGALAGLALGLGDFFLAGLLVIQTKRKYGRKAGIIAAAAITVSFFITEILLLNFYRGRGFPATVMVIVGWIPVAAWKVLSERKQANKTITAPAPN